MEVFRKRNQMFSLVFDTMLLSEQIERVSVSCMQIFFGTNHAVRDKVKGHGVFLWWKVEVGGMTEEFFYDEGA